MQLICENVNLFVLMLLNALEKDWFIFYEIRGPLFRLRSCLIYCFLESSWRYLFGMQMNAMKVTMIVFTGNMEVTSLQRT